MTSSANTYGVRAYLRDKAPVIIAFLLFGAFMTLMLVVLKVVPDAIVLLDVLLAILLGIVLAVDYMRRSRFWNALEDASESVEKIEHFNDLSDDPSFLDGVVAREVLDNLVKCSESEIADLQLDHRSNEQYIEQWVHEVKTPIATSGLILNQMHGPDADALRREMERIERLVEQALFAARSDSLSGDYIIADVKLSELVGDACKSNMQLLTAKGIRPDIQVPEGMEVLADKTWLEFILSQLIVNSAKYDSSEIAFSARDSSAEGSSGETVLEVKDDGCGIPAEDVPRVFDRGFTGAVGRAYGSATGMGLYLAARMCAQMGIGISVASEEGAGTRVSLSFPHDNQRRRMLRKLTLS